MSNISNDILSSSEDAMKKLIEIIAFLVVVSLMAGCGGGGDDPTSSPTFYNYTILLPQGWDWSINLGLNNNGQVVGYGDVMTLWDSGQGRGFVATPQ
jgi:hypothetical protein